MDRSTRPSARPDAARNERAFTAQGSGGRRAPGFFREGSRRPALTGWGGDRLTPWRVIPMRADGGVAAEIAGWRRRISTRGWHGVVPGKRMVIAGFSPDPTWLTVLR